MFGLPKFGDGIGLHRIEQFMLAHRIDRAALARKSIAVTGTNGKGSTSRFITSAIEAAGLRVGCFTSPHLFDVRERFTIGADMIPREAFERYQADAVTVNPYMGFDSIQPYLEHEGKGVIVLCRTSNAGGSDLQFLETGGRPLYQVVAQLAADKWNASGQLGLVVGATFPTEIEVVRGIVGDMPLLIPGIGAQGGDVQATVNAGRTANGTGMLINSSRAIIYAGKGDDFAEAAAKAAMETRDRINAFR